jgi:hypothetical protein
MCTAIGLEYIGYRWRHGKVEMTGQTHGVYRRLKPLHNRTTEQRTIFFILILLYCRSIAIASVAERIILMQLNFIAKNIFLNVQKLKIPVVCKS